MSADTFEAAASAAGRGDYAAAIDIASRLLARNPRDPNALQVLGLAFGRQGRNDEALAAFTQADAIAPNNPPVLNSIGVLLKERGDLAGARARLKQAARLNSSFVEAHYNLAATLAAMDERDLARASYENAIRANPKSAEALGRFAKFLEEEHDAERARDLATRALAIAPANASAHLALAGLDATAGDHASVVQRMEAALGGAAQAPQSAALFYGMLSRSLEKLGRYGESFTACAQANDIQHAYYAGLMARQRSPRSPATVARLAAFFDEADVGGWTSYDDLDGPSPVFLLGFPRSGTTLLDQILSSHDRIAVLEEKENMIDAWSELIVPENGLARLASLRREEVNRYRKLYWDRIASHIEAPEGTLIIDKLPLDTALLGLIYRLFPEARIIFALRDPRDVVLSCFQQTFAMNLAMYQFLKLDTAARYYHQVMSLGRLYRRKLSLNLYEVRYENVVGNLRGEIEPLLAFLGIEWRDAMERYYETARKRVIKTPSAKQVIEKPYRSSIGKWRHYEQQMAPILPLLEPWVKEFGY